MTRPTLEVADILRAQGDRFLDRYRSSFDFQQLKAFRAIQRCRTAALGGHRDACLRCGHQAISYNSCRNRHCPKCQTQARQRWLAARERELLATSYFHVVFTVPHELNVLALDNARLFYHLLFTASAQTLLEIAADPKHLGAKIGVISILHTWGQNLLLHPHIHCAIPAGGLSLDHCRWIRPRYPFFLPVKILSRVFRGKFLAGFETPPSQQETTVRRPRRGFGRLCTVHSTDPPPAPSRLGGLCQAPPLVVPFRCCAILGVTPIGWPFPIIACWPSSTSASPFTGRITPRAANQAR